MRPEQAKQIIRHEGVLTFEVAAISLRESPTSCQLQSTGSPKQRPSARSQILERSASSACMCFPFIGSMMSCS